MDQMVAVVLNGWQNSGLQSKDGSQMTLLGGAV